MKKLFTLFLVTIIFLPAVSWGQTYNYFAGDGSALSSSKWGTSAAGPFSTFFTSGSIATFAITNGTGSGAVGITIGGINATENFTYSSPSGTLSTGGSLVSINVSSGKLLDLSSMNISTTAGTGISKDGAGTLMFSGTNAYPGGFTLNAGTIVIGSTNALGSGGTLNVNGGTLCASSSKSLTSKFSAININSDFMFGNSSYAANLSFSDNVVLGSNVTRTITLGSTGVYTFNGIISGTDANLTVGATAAGTLVLSGGNSYSGLTTISGGTLQLNRTGGTTIPNTNNIIISGGTLKVSTNQTINNFTMSSGTLTVDSGITLTITGTYNVSGGTISNSGTIKLNGGAASFPGSGAAVNNGTSGTMTNLEIATSSDVTLTSSFTISGTLTLTSGNIVSGSSSLLTLSTTASISGGSSSSFINGPLAQTINVVGPSSKTFTIGKGSSYRPLTITITHGSTITTIYTAEVFNNAPTSRTLTASLDKVSSVRYYNISKGSGAAVTAASIQLSYNSDDGVNSSSDLRIAGVGSGKWVDLGGTGTTNTSGTITSTTSFTTFSDFVLANALGGANPLPVQLTSFAGAASGNGVMLNWATATEVNNYGFNVECRMENGEWSKIGFVQGHGNSNSPKNYTFTDANAPAGNVSYRLKQIDFDGKFEYSDVVNINVAAPVSFSVKQNFPNPFNPATTIKYELPASNYVTIKVFDIIGREIETLVNKNETAGTHSVNFNAKSLPSGMYIYKVQAGSYSQIKKMLLVK